MNKSTMAVAFIALFSLPFSTWSRDSVLIPSGSFQMGCSLKDDACGKDEGTKGGTPVDVAAFKIDRYEVTVAQYSQCVASGMCSKPKDMQRNQYCNYGNPQRQQHPLNCIDWDQALAFCQAHKGRLPSEAEWEKAARARSTSRYPWGQEVSCKNAILDDGKTMGSVPNEPDGCGEDRTWPVGSRAANAFGLYDMHGNAGEWVMNWYNPEAISQLYAKGALLAPENGRQRGVRGGSWDENKANLRSSYRNVKPPQSGNLVYGSIGFRCTYAE